jgi:outer membrane protein TolC
MHSDIQAMSDEILIVTRPMDLKLQLDVAQRTKQDHFNQLKVDVYKASLNILLCEKEIATQEQKLATAEEELKMATARFKAATITQNDLDSAQYSVDDKKVSLANSKEKLDSLYLEMKKLLNQPLDTVPVKISGEIKQEKFEDTDVDFQINRIYATETSVYTASGKLDIAKTAMDIAKSKYQEGILFYDNVAMDLKEAEYDLTSAKTALEVKVKNYYNTMVNDLDDLQLAGQYTDLMKKKLSNSEIMYNKGTISKDDYNKAKDALLDAELAELSSIVAFDGARADFRNVVKPDEIVK